MSESAMVGATVLIAAAITPLAAQTRPLGVCAALNSAADHQVVSIHAAFVATESDGFTGFYEGTG